MTDSEVPQGNQDGRATQSTHSELSEREQVKSIRAEIWRLALTADSMELLHWYVALDDCFENDEFLDEDAENMRWRLLVLTDKKEDTARLFRLIDGLLPLETKRRLTT